ncbi:hypothetical protein NMG60_11035676 [Bertholletia excelsa]
MNAYKENKGISGCYFHPEEVIVGICPLCLNERLLILAANLKQERRRHMLPSESEAAYTAFTDRSQKSVKHRIFALGSSLLHRSSTQPHHLHHSHADVDDTSATSREESFISIKFEDNGVASWEKGTVSKVSLEHCNVPWTGHGLGKETNKETNNKESKSVIEHAKPRGSLRWRKRIGHLFQLSRWKRSGKGNACHVEGVKVRSGWWIRTLTKRRPKE